MSEVPAEKVYVRNRPSGLPILVNALGMRLGAQEFLHIHGDSSGMKSATVKLSVDGRWSPEVAKEYIKSATDASAVFNARVSNTEAGSAVELYMPGLSSDYVLINGEKFVRDQPSKLVVSDFNRILEYLPDAAGALIERRGVTVGEFRELVRRGEITFEEVGLSIARCAEPSKKQESKLSVEVDTSAVEAPIKRIEDAQKVFLKSHVATGSVSIAGEVAAFEPFPICPLESAISETVRHLREGQEFNLKAPPEVQRPDEPNQMLAQHLKKLLSAQYERMSK